MKEIICYESEDGEHHSTKEDAIISDELFAIHEELASIWTRDIKISDIAVFLRKKGYRVKNSC